MKHYLCAAVGIIFTFTLSSCIRMKTSHHTQPVTSQRLVREFNKIEVDANCDVHFVQGDQLKLMIVGPKEAVNGIVSECKGNTLMFYNDVKRKLFTLQNNDNVEIYITAPNLLGVTMKGSGDFSIDGDLDTDTLNVNLLGNGDIHFNNVICDVITATLKGNCDLDIDKLQCSSSTFNLYGVGDIDIHQNKVSSTTILLKGVGDVNVNFNQCEEAKCLLFGVGDINLSGTLRSLKRNVKGTGDIDTDQLKHYGTTNM